MATVTVQKGDTLYKIAGKITGMVGSVLRSYVDALVSINNISDPNKIFPGQVLQYPDAWLDKPAATQTADTVVTGQVIPANRPAKSRRVLPAARPGGWQSIFKNPIVLGAVALGVLLYVTQRSK